jgi:hypothetical protein
VRCEDQKRSRQQKRRKKLEEKIVRNILLPSAPPNLKLKGESKKNATSITTECRALQERGYEHRRVITFSRTFCPRQGKKRRSSSETRGREARLFLQSNQQQQRRRRGTDSRSWHESISLTLVSLVLQGKPPPPSSVLQLLLPSPRL